MKTDSYTRTIISGLSQSPLFALQVYNLGKTPDKVLSESDLSTKWNTVAMSLPRFYAVVEAAEMAVSLRHASSLEEAFKEMANGSGNSSPLAVLANKSARLAWQAQQPLIGMERLGRPIMGCTSACLPDNEEFQKDVERVKMTARLLIETLAQNP